MSPSTLDALWLGLTVAGIVGGLLMWLALDDPWWLAAAVVLGLALTTGAPSRGRDR